MRVKYSTFSAKNKWGPTGKDACSSLEKELVFGTLNG